MHIDNTESLQIYCHFEIQNSATRQPTQPSATAPCACPKDYVVKRTEVNNILFYMAQAHRVLSESTPGEGIP